MDIEKIRQLLNAQSSSSEMPAELKGFNWGAFLLTFIWGIKYKVWITLLAIPLIWFQLPLGLNWILLTFLQVYCGIKGNEWAYKIDYKKSNYDFKMTQIKWAIFGFSLQIIIPMIILFVLCLFLFKSEKNPMDFVLNAQCKIAYNNIKKGLYQVDVKLPETEIAENFAKKFKDAHSDYNSVNFSVNGKGQTVDLYYIRFLKQDGNSCSIINQNCKIESGFLFPEEIMEAFGSVNECVFYFDNYKNIIPTEQTQRKIQKGYNIFKYL